MRSGEPGGNGFGAGAAVALAIALALGLAGCGERTAEPRAQHVVVVDTNAPIVGQLADSPELSPDSAIDTLFIEVLDDLNNPIQSETFVRADLDDWPVSFGIAIGERVRLRLVAYRALFTDKIGGTTVPMPEMAIERVVVLERVSDVEHTGVILDADCRGTRPSFVGEPKTCIDAARVDAPASEGLGDSPSEVTTLAGTWTPARDRPCSGAPPPGAVCIPGGFSALGESRIVDLTPDPQPLVPLRPSIISPFWMDVHEFTVARYKALVNTGQVKGDPPRLKKSDPNEGDFYCTWAGTDVDDNDDFALSCVTYDSAKELCALSGGRLPSEAEWEHAARGRGQRRLVPWGDVIECCHASVGRGAYDPFHDCPGTGAEPVGSHPPSAACGGEGDVSRDGVFDLAGGVGEFTRDQFALYDEDCWQTAALLKDPTCGEPDEFTVSLRGGNWSSAPMAGRSPLRSKLGYQNPLLGFRCVYDSP